MSTLRFFNSTYHQLAKRSLALLFLLLFLNGFVVETMAFHWNDACQSELVDSEGEKDTEEDNKDEKEKENKILEWAEPTARHHYNTPVISAYQLASVSEEIHEVLSPPPDVC